jgi:O-antigen ligase
MREIDLRGSSDSREWSLVAVIGVELMILPWMLGSMQLGPQSIALGLSLLALILALTPRTITCTDGREVRFCAGRRFWRSLLCWAGLAFVGYVVCQRLNYSWDYRTDGRSWWLVKVPSISWLPNGIRTPFARMNTWRFLVIGCAAWFTFVAIWAGLTRRRSILTLLVVITVNGTLQAVLGLAQQMSATTKIYWTFVPANERFFASFHYKNHAAAYLNLACIVAIAIGSWFQRRQQRRLARSSPAPLFYFFAAVIAIAIVLSLSRAGTLLLAACLFIAIPAFTFWRLRFEKREGRPWVPILLVALLFGLAGFALTRFDTRDMRFGFTSLVDGSPGRLTVDRRFDAYRATWDMIKDRWLMGWGAGCWRYIFPVYQQHYPSIWADNGKRLVWEYAHNDIFQLLAEVGVLGCALLTLVFAPLMAVLRRWHFRRNPAIGLGLLACATTFTHAWMDFVLSDPAVMITAFAVLWLFGRWIELESQGPNVDLG